MDVVTAGVLGFDWNSEHTSLNPFTYPVPETRFFHAGVNVYKFKLKYGNTINANIDLHENIVNEELEEAIRVILGNLNHLHPFTTEHLVVFPYLNKWEKVSDLRFKRGDAFLVPYPYVCTVYVELNSGQQNLFLDKTEYGDTCNFVDDGGKLSTSMDMERAMKWRRQGSAAEISLGRLHVDRNEARDATCSYGASSSQVGRVRLQKDTICATKSVLQDQPEEMQHRYCRAAIVNSVYDNKTLGKHVEYDKTENSDHRQQEQRVQVLPQGAEEHAELKKRGFLELLKRTLFPPLLQRVFRGTSQPS